MPTGEFDTTDSSQTPREKLKGALDSADRVNGSIIRLCCSLYTLAREAGVDRFHASMQAAEKQLKYHSLWDSRKWGDGPTEQSSDGDDGAG